MKNNKLCRIVIVALMFLGLQMIFTVNNNVLAEEFSGGTPQGEEKYSIENTIINVIPQQTYTGGQIQPNVIVTYNNMKLIQGIDYTVTYTNNINVGTAQVEIIGNGKYQGKVIRYFNIVAKKLSTLKINVITPYTYTGKVRNAKVKVYNGSKKLKEKTDYTLKYSNNIKTGKATVRITGKGNYTGSVNKYYYIAPKKATITSVVMNTKFTKATITWKKDTQASGYQIFRATSKNGKYTKIKTITKNKTTKYVATKLNAKKTYYFKVRSYKKVGSKTIYSKSYSNPKTNTALLASVKLTSKGSTKNRNNNLKIASKYINGLVLKPGQTFNWYNVVGPATKKKGYKTATVFAYKKAVQGVGGGVCQVSTTLYQASLKAKLKIVERHQHSLPVSYTTRGKDATVSYGAQNLRIKNNKKYAIKFVTSSSGGSTTCKIYKVNY